MPTAQGTVQSKQRALDSCDSVGLPPHSVHFRPDGSTQGGFMVGFTTSALHQQGSAAMSPMSWSSHKVKRSVSTSLAGEVFMMSDQRCVGVGLSRLRTLVASTGIDIITRGAHGDRHEGGQPSAG